MKTENESRLAEANKKCEKAEITYLEAKRASILADIERDILKKKLGLPRY